MLERVLRDIIPQTGITIKVLSDRGRRGGGGKEESREASGNGEGIREGGRSGGGMRRGEGIGGRGRNGSLLLLQRTLCYMYVGRAHTTYAWLPFDHM